MLERPSVTHGLVQSPTGPRLFEPERLRGEPANEVTPAREGIAGSRQFRKKAGDSVDLSPHARRAREETDAEARRVGDSRGDDVSETRENPDQGLRIEPRESDDEGLTGLFVEEKEEDEEASGVQAYEDVAGAAGRTEGSKGESDEEGYGLSPEEEVQVRELRERDREVRTHEQAHAGVGGSLAGAPQYEYERGPDGRAYAVEGEVPIQLREGRTPEETARLAQRVQRAALAPANPSSRDRQVAAKAARMEQEAKAEAAEQRAEALEADELEQAAPAFTAGPLAESEDEEGASTRSGSGDEELARALDARDAFRDRFQRYATDAYSRVLERRLEDEPKGSYEPPSFSGLA